jgi:hydroxymethylpyrimidine/phosphomethylpyrimidine kinase
MAHLKFSPSANPPVILTISCLDPSGSGGIQADIETSASIGTHCAPLISAICTTGESPEREIIAVDPELLIEQARSILAEMDVRVIKLGFLGSIENIEAVHSILTEFPELPTVSHPTMNMWDTDEQPLAAYTEAYSRMILPSCEVVILTEFEARELAKEADTLDAIGQEILNSSCESLLITGTGKQSKDSRNSFYHNNEGVRHFEWHQESAASQGSSSTLAMSTAAYLAHGFSLLQAIEESQHFTEQATYASRQIGFGRPTLHRLYWADSNIDHSNKPVSKTCH